MSAATPTTMRLDRLLSNMGYGSRRDVQEMVRVGLVVLDGKPVAKADERVVLAADLALRMSINGKPLDPLPGMVLMLHKPIGMTCSHKEAGPLVYDLLPKRWRSRDPAISTIGRLDKETSGLLVLTDDGALLHRVIAPKSQVSKCYEATLARPLRGDEGALFNSGTLMLDGETKPLAPAVLVPIDDRHAWLTVTEGRYHQVRRMFAAAGNHVEALHRISVGGLRLPADLEPGHWRVLGATEIASLFEPPAA